MNLESIATKEPEAKFGIQNPLDRPASFLRGRLLGGTDQGFNYEKERQEDALGVRIEGDLNGGVDCITIIIADGVGGDPDGDIAAQYAAAAVADIKHDMPLAKAHLLIHNKMKNDDFTRSAASYLVIRLKKGEQLEVLPVGDCMLIIYGPGGEVKFRTSPHRTYRQGKEYLAKWVCGDENDLPPIDDPLSIKVSPGDIVIAATDGIWDNFSPEDIALMIKNRSIEEAFRIIEVATRLKMTLGLPEDIASQISGMPTDDAIILMHQLAELGDYPIDKPDNRTLLIYEFKDNAP